MDKEKAVKTLTAELVKHFDSLIVRDERYKNRLIGDAEYFYQSSNPVMIGFDLFSIRNKESGRLCYERGFVNNEFIKKPEKYTVYKTFQKALSREESCKEANYFFVDESLPVSVSNVSDKVTGVSFFVTPYSIITKKEIDNLTKIFYKDVPPDVVYAMSVLDIKNFIEVYQYYINDPDVFENFELSKFLKLTPRLGYDRDGEISNSKFEEIIGRRIDLLNNIFGKIGIEARISLNPSHIYKKNLAEVVEQLKEKKPDLNHYIIPENDPNDPDFFRFVFSLPSEEQNVKSNKEILKRVEDLEFIVNIVSREYIKGKNFCDYFDVLNKNVQQKVVSALKSVSRNTIYDSFLWKQGFKDVELDYLKLYGEDAKSFIEYFKDRKPEEKKIILEGIMDCEFTNNGVVKWLDKNESELIREVGLKNG